MITKAIERLLLTEPYEVAVTQYEGNATEIVLNRLQNLQSDDFLRIYACGGDGTLSEVVSGVILSGKENCAVGVVPIGSGNDFVKYFKDIPAEKFRSLQDMTRGYLSGCDIISVKDSKSGCERVSINIVSAGFDAAVAKEMTKYKKIPFVSGSAAYNLSVVECLISKMKHRFTLVADGNTIKDSYPDYLFAICANGRYYGGGYKASPISDINDGYIDFIRIKTVSRFTFAALVGSFKKGEHLENMKQYCTHALCKELKILADREIDMNIDGEIVPMINPTIKIKENAIKLILPQQ